MTAARIGLPAITRTVRPSIAGTPVWYAETGGETPEVGPTPTFGAVGAISAGDVQDVTPGFPTGITAGQLLILHVESTNIANAPATPAGWTLQYGDQRNIGSGNAVRHWVFSRYADGTETGTLTVDFTATGTKTSYICRIENPHPSVPFEGAILVQGTDDPITGPTLTPLGVNRLGMAFIAAGDANIVETVLAGATGGTWVGRVVDAEGAGLDSEIFLNTVNLSAGTAISGGSFSPNMTSTADWILRGTMIRPSGA